MGKRNKRRPAGFSIKIGRMVKLTGILLALLGILTMAVVAMYWFYARYEANVDIQRALAFAERDAETAQMVIAQREAELSAWTYSLRSSGSTEAAEILRSTAQGCRILGARQLYLVDEGGLYYGSNGTISQASLYADTLSRMQEEAVTFRWQENIVVCLRVKPFTVDGSTFCWAVAEYDPVSYQQEIGMSLWGGGSGAQILDADGREFLLIFGGRSVLSLLDTLELVDYDSSGDLIREILDREQVTAQCLAGSARYSLISKRLPGKNWILLTLDSMPELPPLTDPMILLYLAATLLLAASAVCLLYLGNRAKKLNRQIREAQQDITRLQSSLEEAMNSNSAQMEFIDTISYNIRTPMNSIVGFTAMAKRYINDPEAAYGYLEKVVDASAQLLSKLNESLDATGWQRYVDDTEQMIEKGKPIRLGGKRILLVDDNALNREIGVAVLSEIGILVECAENGEEGFQKVAKSRPGYYDLVLMDIQMPVLDGYEATQMIRRLRTKMLAEIPILAMSANTTLEDRQRALEAGMDGYLEKPMNIDKLMAAIRGALRPSSASKEQNG